MEPDVQKLASAVKHRREELRLSQDAIAKRGGPSTTTVSDIEGGIGKVPRPSTLKKLDEALEWVPGSSEKILAGGSPTIMATTGNSSKLGSATLGQIILPGDVAEGLDNDERAEVQSAAEAAARKRAREIRYERSKLDRERVRFEDPVGQSAAEYDQAVQAKLARLAQDDYAPAANPPIQDPYEGLGEESQD